MQQLDLLGPMATKFEWGHARVGQMKIGLYELSARPAKAVRLMMPGLTTFACLGSELLPFKVRTRARALPCDPSSFRTAPNQTLPGTCPPERLYGVVPMHSGLTQASQTNSVVTVRIIGVHLDGRIAAARGSGRVCTLKLSRSDPA